MEPAPGKQTESSVKIQQIRPEFVVSFPAELKEGVLYISEEYATAAHKCCCGCGEKVLTPLKPSKWRLIVSAAGVSLTPSIGNWKFACQSHYWIRQNRVIDAGMMSKQKIETVKVKDKLDNQRYIAQTNSTAEAKRPPATKPAPSQSDTGVSAKLVKKLSSWLKGL
jgi:hypothetical protein